MTNRNLILTLIVFLLPLFSAEAQSIRGKVTDAKGEPLTEAVAVLRAGCQTKGKQSVTDEKGVFEMELPQRQDSLFLTITFMGYSPIKVVVTPSGRKTDLGELRMEENATELGTVSVTAESGPDRTFYFPSKAIKDHSSDGYDLLFNMMLPGVKVNTITGLVSTSDNGKVVVYINDIEATKQKLTALRPDEVMKVEYVDMPGAEYGALDVKKVIKITTKRRNDGITGNVNLKNALTTVYGYNSGYVNYNRGMSEFSANVSYMYSYNRNSTKSRLSQSNVYNMESGPFNLAREGIKRGSKSHQTGFGLSYNYTHPNKDVLEASFSYYNFSNPYRDDWQRISETGKADFWSQVRNPQGNKLAVGYVYFKHYFSTKHNLVASAVYNNLRSTYAYERTNYTNSGMTELMDNFGYSVYGITNFFSTELKHYIEVGHIALSSGARYMHSHLNNSYSSLNSVTNRINNDNLYLYSQAGGRIASLSYLAGVGLSNQHDSQNGINVSKWTFRPFVNLSTRVGKLQLRYNFYLSPVTPSLGSKANNIQQTSEWEYTEGNPYLRTNTNYSNQLVESISVGPVYLYNSTTYYYGDHPIMGDVERKEINGKEAFVSSMFNQKSRQWIQNYFWLQVRLIPDVLTLQGGVNYTFYKNVGNNYRHYLNNLSFDVSSNLYLKRWTFQANWSSRSQSLTGETKTTTHPNLNISANYKIGNIRIGLQGDHLFDSSPCTLDTEMLNRYVKKKEKIIFRPSGNYVSLSLVWNFQKGRKKQNERGQVNTSGSDAGIMQVM